MTLPANDMKDSRMYIGLPSRVHRSGYCLLTLRRKIQGTAMTPTVATMTNTRVKGMRRKLKPSNKEIRLHLDVYFQCREEIKSRKAFNEPEKQLLYMSYEIGQRLDASPWLDVVTLK
jgi:hypothetical protein